MKRIVFVLAMIVLATSIITPYAILANMHSNTIDPVGEREVEGRFGFITVLIGCTSGERVRVRVTVTQEDANSVAEGWTSAACTGEQQRLPVRVRALAKTRLSTGASVACALATTRTDGRVTDTRQWCKDITLNDN